MGKDLNKYLFCYIDYADTSFITCKAMNYTFFFCRHIVFYSVINYAFIILIHNLKLIKLLAILENI